ncbi:MAG TPA: hypothetical protein VF193_06130 [Steroidobacter sp.]
MRVGMFGWLSMLGVMVGLAGCAATQGRLANSAERLERSAYELEQEARDEDGGYRRDAEEFAEETRSFRRMIEDRADDEEIAEAFEDLSRRYHALRDEVERSSDADAERDFRPVTQAYLDVEREMRRTRDRVALDKD